MPQGNPSLLTSACCALTIAWHAIIKQLLGKGQCWEAEYQSDSTSRPTSSATSRWTASSMFSPKSNHSQVRTAWPQGSKPCKEHVGTIISEVFQPWLLTHMQELWLCWPGNTCQQDAQLSLSTMLTFIKQRHQRHFCCVYIQLVGRTMLPLFIISLFKPFSLV